MKKILVSTVLLLVLILISYTIFDKNRKQALQQNYFYMDTLIDIRLFDHKDEKHLKNISALLKTYENAFSKTIKTSDIYLLNQKKHAQVSPATYDLLEKSLYYSQLSEGYFDISILPLMDLWGFGSDEESVPSLEQIQASLKAIDYKKIQLLGQGKISLEENSALDLGGIAKGFVADRIVDYLKENDIKKALINLGGNVYVHGTNPDEEDWTVGIKHPDPSKNKPLLTLKTSDQSVVTSGIYERHFIEAGHLYHHILDPYTGYPADNDLVSLTVLSNKSIDGDALSTAFFLLGKEKAIQISKDLDDLEIIIITKEQKVYLPKTLLHKVQLLDETYQLLSY